MLMKIKRSIKYNNPISVNKIWKLIIKPGYNTSEFCWEKFKGSSVAYG